MVSIDTANDSEGLLLHIALFHGSQAFLGTLQLRLQHLNLIFQGLLLCFRVSRNRRDRSPGRLAPARQASGSPHRTPSSPAVTETRSPCHAAPITSAHAEPGVWCSIPWNRYLSSSAIADATSSHCPLSHGACPISSWHCHILPKLRLSVGWPFAMALCNRRGTGLTAQ